MTKNNYKNDTKNIIAGKRKKLSNGFVNSPVYKGSTVLFNTVEEMQSKMKNKNSRTLFYGRFGSPATFEFENAIADIDESYTAVATASGTAAIVASLLAVLKTGDHILMTDSAYGVSRNITKKLLNNMGITTTFYNPNLTNKIKELITNKTKLIFMESPGSLTFEIQNISMIVDIAKKYNLITVIDNTWATSLYLKPMNYGVDISIQSATKYIVGHSDAMLGVITTNKKYAKQIAGLIKDAGMADMPVGVDYAETAMFHALQQEGINVIDGQQIMLAAREIKNWDEIQLLTQAASMVDGVYHMIYEELKPGVRENDIVALSNKMLYEMGSDDVEAINAISGERCNPHPHNFTDRYFRPGDQAFFDILQSYQGYRTCYYRTFNIGRATSEQNDAYVKCREWLDASIAMIKPGVTTDKVAEVWPTAESLGFPSEDAAFGLQFGHGLGLALHERPIISRAISLEHPMEIKTGMVFALETYCPAKDGFSAARIEEEVVVTDTGCEVISLFPAEELPISNKY